MTFQTRGIESNQWFDRNFNGFPAQAVTLLYAPILWPNNVSMPASIATYNAATGTITIVKPGPWCVCTNVTTVPLKISPTGTAVLPTGVPAGERVSVVVIYNGQGFVEFGIGDEGANGDSFVYNFAVGDTLQWVVGQTAGALASVALGSSITGGPMY